MLKTIRALLLCSASLLGASGVAQPTATLRSPWDTAPIALTSVPYTCESIPTLPRNIVATSYYSDAKHSVADTAKKDIYDAAHEPFLRASDATAKAADSFVATGSRDAAACVLHNLTMEAQAGAMTGSMSSNQAQYVQNWTLGALAISWLKVKQSHLATPEQLAVITPWMRSVAVQVKTWFDARRAKNTTDSRNNHLYWAGFAVMSAGIAVDDRKLYDWGVGTYKDGVGRIEPDGTLPLEMARGTRALHYHLFALAPLVTMAELGEANGDDLYALDHAKLHLLVARAMAGLADNHFFAEKAGALQDTPEPDGIKSSDIEWVRPFQRRFPDAATAKLLDRVGIQPFGYLGGLPPA